MTNEFSHCITWIGEPTIFIGNGQATVEHKRMARTEAEARQIAIELSTNKHNSMITVWAFVECLRWDVDYAIDTNLQEGIF